MPTGFPGQPEFPRSRSESGVSPDLGWETREGRATPIHFSAPGVPQVCPGFVETGYKERLMCPKKRTG